jgi:hypothetical protein
MNCTQVEELLPLYAGQDLAEGREQLVTAHLQSCAACSLAVAEYRETRGLMQDFTPAVFDDEVYAAIRQNVWEQIESQPQSRALFEWISVRFQPRLGWAAATALMIAVSFVGLYFIGKEFNGRPTAIVDGPRTFMPVVGPPPEALGGAPLIPGEGPPKRQVNSRRRQRKPDRMVAPDRGNSLAAYSPGAEVSTVQSSSPAIGTENLDSAVHDQKTLRMEIQTKDPNIRIIWFLSESPNQ